MKKNNKDFGFGSGSGFTFNCAARVRVGSGQMISGSGFSLKPVQTSSLSWSGVRFPKTAGRKFCRYQ